MQLMHTEAFLGTSATQTAGKEAVLAVGSLLKAFPDGSFEEQTSVTYGSGAGDPAPAGTRRVGCAIGQHPGDCVTIEGFAPSSPADQTGQAEGLLRPKSEESETEDSEAEPAEEQAEVQAENLQVPKEEVDWSGNEPEEAEERQQRIQKKLKKQRKAARRAAHYERKEARRRKREEAKAELQESDPPAENPPEEGLTKTEVPQEELPNAEPSEEGLPKTESKTEEEKARQRETIVQLLSESLKAKREQKRKAQEEAEADLPKAECASGSTDAKEEPEEKIDFDKADLKSLWDQGRTDSGSKYESLSSTECNDPKPIILKRIFAKTQKAERKAKAITKKKAASTPSWQEQAKGSGSSGSRN